MWRNYIGLTVEDVVGKEFQCFQDAYKFYCDYAICCRFVVHKDDMAKNKTGEIRWRQYVCNRERERNKKHLMRSDRKREHRLLTRIKCTAKIRVTQHHLTFFILNFCLRTKTGSLEELESKSILQNFCSLTFALFPNFAFLPCGTRVCAQVCASELLGQHPICCLKTIVKESRVFHFFNG